MRFILSIPFIFNAVLAKADIIYEGCLGYPIANAESIILRCHHWPSVHRIVNDILLNRREFTQLIFSRESMSLFGKIASSQNFTPPSFPTYERQLSTTTPEYSNILDIIWDTIFHCTLKRKSRYVLVFSDTGSGINIQDYLKQSIHSTMEIQFVKCQHQHILNKRLNYMCVFVSCDLKDTRKIINTAIGENLVTESYSWIILTEDETALQDVIYKKKDNVINDLVLISHSEYMSVAFTRNESFNSSTMNAKLYRDSTGYVTRLSKPCSEAQTVKWTVPLSKTQDLHFFQSQLPPDNLSGCNVTVLVLLVPPLASTRKDSNSLYGIDYEFLALTHRALGATATYQLLTFQEGIEMALNDDPLETLNKIGHFDTALPLYGTDDETLNSFIDYTMPFLQSSFSILVKTNPKSFSGENALKVFILPFAPTVWWLVLTVCFATTVAWTLVRRCHSSRRSNYILSVWESSFDIISIMPGQGVWDVMTGMSYKVVLATISIFTLINLNCYSAKIIAFLTDTRPVVPFTSVQEFVESDDYGFATEYEHSFVNLSELYKVLHNTKSQILSAMRNKKFTTTKFGEDYSELPDNIGKNAYVTYREISDFITITHSPRLVQPIKEIAITPKQMPIRKGFPHKKLYFDKLKRLHEAGIYNKFRSETMYKLENIDNRRHVEVTVTAIELAAVSILFQWHLIGIIASLIALFIEKKLT